MNQNVSFVVVKFKHNDQLWTEAISVELYYELEKQATYEGSQVPQITEGNGSGPRGIRGRASGNWCRPTLVVNYSSSSHSGHGERA